jgi:serine/threonine-protein kinase
VAIGGSGPNYAAEATHGVRVAVKVIECRPSAAQVVRFSQEIEKLRLAADHPGIIRCYEHGDIDIDGRVCPWYSMPFALGGDLRSRIDKRKGLLKGRLPWHEPATKAEVCWEFMQIANAVAHLHRLEIVHRDIKPGNVLIMEDGSLRLSDFGLVKNLVLSEEMLRHGPQTSTGEGPGTPGYMAPEQARGQNVGTTADVYSLGILLAELVVGKRPAAEIPLAVEGKNTASRIGSTLKGCRDLDKLPRGLKRLIESCTDVVPEQRPRDAQAVVDEFVSQGFGMSAPVATHELGER